MISCSEIIPLCLLKLEYYKHKMSSYEIILSKWLSVLVCLISILESFKSILEAKSMQIDLEVPIDVFGKKIRWLEMNFGEDKIDLKYHYQT